MTDPQSTPDSSQRKCCSRHEKCIHPDGPWLPLTEFARNRRQKDGLQNQCRSCHALSKKQWKEAHREERTAYEKRYYQERGRDLFQARYRAKREQIRAKQRARYWANHEQNLVNGRIRYRLNAEANRARRRAYYRANKTVILQKDRAYRILNRECIRERQRRYYRSTREQRREVSDRWARAHPAKLREYKRRWRAKNPDYGRLQHERRRGREQSASGTHTLYDIRAQFAAQGGRCWWCGKPVGDDYHVDHRVPLAKGGGNGAENLCIACPRCNLSKGDKLPWEWNGRLL